MSHFLLFFTFSSVGHVDNGLMPHRQPEPGLKREQQRRRVSNEVVPSRTPVVVTPNYSYPVTSPPPIQIQLIFFYCSFLTLLFILVLLIVGEYKNLFFLSKAYNLLSILNPQLWLCMRMHVYTPPPSIPTVTCPNKLIIFQLSFKLLTKIVQI